MKFKLAHQLALALLGAVVFTSVGKVQSQTVDWGTSYSENPLSFLSDGSVDNQVLTWQLGWFADGFVPDQTNYLSWATNWNPVDTNAHLFIVDNSFPSGGLWSVSGHVDDVGVEAGGLVSGGGEFSFLVPDSNATPADSLNGTFEVQAATWPIPGPSAAFLIALVG